MTELEALEHVNKTGYFVTYDKVYSFIVSNPFSILTYKSNELEYKLKVKLLQQYSAKLLFSFDDFLNGRDGARITTRSIILKLLPVTISLMHSRKPLEILARLKKKSNLTSMTMKELKESLRPLILQEYWREKYSDVFLTDLMNDLFRTLNAILVSYDDAMYAIEREAENVKL